MKPANDASSANPQVHQTTTTLAIIGGGPSALFTLKHLVDDPNGLKNRFDRIIIFEANPEFGPGMPYSKVHSSDLNLSNISSEELPPLPITFEKWLNDQSPETLERLRVKTPVRSDAIYPRVALGSYFKDQFHELVRTLEEIGVAVGLHHGTRISDIRARGDVDGYDITTENGEKHSCNAVVIATGHHWEKDEDRVNFASPWPIHKLLPSEGRFHNHPIGLLGASLSAVDVVNVLAHHHGRFTNEGRFGRYEPSPECPDFKLVMHSADGLLSHLQFEQDHPLRKRYRHCGEDEINRLTDKMGRLSLDRYFDRICRPALVDALSEDGMNQEASRLSEPGFTFTDFAAMMKEKHLSDEPFELMKVEYSQASADVSRDRTTHWKEVLDDLMYTLNFHAEMLSAEDHLKLRSEVLPFVMSVMAALPLKSARLLVAVYEAGRLEMVPGMAKIEHQTGETVVKVSVEAEEGENQYFEYPIFIDCSGQSPVGVKDFPFPSLARAGLVRRATSPFEDPAEAENGNAVSKTTNDATGHPATKLGGLDVTDAYQLVAEDGSPVNGLYDIAVSHVAGLRPYCYGLQACNEAADILVSELLRDRTLKNNPSPEVRP